MPIDDGAAGVMRSSSSATSSASPDANSSSAAVPALVARHGSISSSPTARTAAAGFGITREIADDLFDTGVHVMTGGNHTWDKKEILDFIAEQPRLLRPANYPAGTPGRGRRTWRPPPTASASASST